MWAFWEFINDEYGGFLSTNLVNETNLSIHELDSINLQLSEKVVSVSVDEKARLLNMKKS